MKQNSIIDGRKDNEAEWDDLHALYVYRYAGRLQRNE